MVLPWILSEKQLARMVARDEVVVRVSCHKNYFSELNYGRWEEGGILQGMQAQAGLEVAVRNESTVTQGNE
jgi:hypothetical protein